MYLSGKTHLFLPLHAPLLRETGNTVIASAQFLGWSKFPRLYGNIGTPPCICISLVKPTFFLPLHAALLREAGNTVIASAQFLGWSKFQRLYGNIGTPPYICISLVKPTFFRLSMLRSSEKQGIPLLCLPWYLLMNWGWFLAALTYFFILNSPSYRKQ